MPKYFICINFKTNTSLAVVVKLEVWKKIRDESHINFSTNLAYRSKKSSRTNTKKIRNIQFLLKYESTDWLIFLTLRKMQVSSFYQKTWYLLLPSIYLILIIWYLINIFDRSYAWKSCTRNCKNWLRNNTYQIDVFTFAYGKHIYYHISIIIL